MNHVVPWHAAGADAEFVIAHAREHALFGKAPVRFFLHPAKATSSSPSARESAIRPHRLAMTSVLSPARASALRCEHLENPVGLDESTPRFSWQLRDPRTGARQSAYEIEVISAGGSHLWTSGHIAGDDSLLIPYGGQKLRPHTRYFWRVRLWDHIGAVTPWSADAQWTTGFLGGRWPPSAKWIGMRVVEPKKSTPVRYLRSPGFELDSTPVAAHLHISALGIFEAHVNGGKVGRDMLTPGWTDYRRRTEYLTYDVTAQVRAGRNALCVLLADGWYAGKLGWHRQRRLYGPTPALLAAVRVVLADGSVRWITRGRDWKVSTGA